MKRKDLPLTYAVPEAGAMVDLSRAASYEAAKRGQIPTTKFGRKLRVPGDLWRRILAEGRPTQAKSAAG
ncbi:hypothetical protein [Bradyrhizobium sp. LMTR 3]|uniref:hypothetical protein n=1 Tax=Bradyrhizobium sp. LMTR 3 TaxID=189873 RepID=UPI00081049E9|nr:hypothetical protein [Bradyrhizobium sp. LMTR 3]OCK56778.1 hypothetical protein LMTR3_14180 [Bradyrhizobium sp. LMTR 3]